MTTFVAQDDLDRFSAVIARRLGLDISKRQPELARDVLHRRLDATGLGVHDYLNDLNDRVSGDEWTVLAQQLTVPETYFFRDPLQFAALAQHVLPDLVQQHLHGSRLRILSAGCASGDEAYSLAIVASGSVPASWAVSVRAVDVNVAVLEKARRGRYSRWALRDTPQALQAQWFRREGDDAVLDESLRHLVTFEQHNLADDGDGLWRAESYDVVFCRNVLMYFVTTAARALMARIAHALAPGGYLFLGHAEALLGVSTAFDLRQDEGTFYYRRNARPVRRRDAGDASRSPASLASSHPVAGGEAPSWFDAIRVASEHVQQLTEPACQATSQRPAAPTPITAADQRLEGALELLDAERFAAAVEVVDAMAPDPSTHPDVVLVQGALLLHVGALERAETVCYRLLELDARNAGAHYLIALCRDGAGDPADAEHHDRLAARLDPAFAMPRLHLGLLAQRAGQPEIARRELASAAALLEQEDPWRLRIFGGGFSRAALVALCRMERVADRGGADAA